MRAVSPFHRLVTEVVVSDDRCQGPECKRPLTGSQKKFCSSKCARRHATGSKPKRGRGDVTRLRRIDAGLCALCGTAAPTPMTLTCDACKARRKATP